jgi:hypothetical protein
MKEERPDVVAHPCNPCYSGCRIKVQGQLGKVNARPYLKNKLKAKGLGARLKG